METEPLDDLLLVELFHVEYYRILYKLNTEYYITFYGLSVAVCELFSLKACDLGNWLRGR